MMILSHVIPVTRIIHFGRSGKLELLGRVSYFFKHSNQLDHKLSLAGDRINSSSLDDCHEMFVFTGYPESGARPCSSLYSIDKTSRPSQSGLAQVTCVRYFAIKLCYRKVLEEYCTESYCNIF